MEKAEDRDHLALLTASSKHLEERLDVSGLAWLQTTLGNCQSRLDNVKAGLQVWHDCLSRVLESWGELEKKLDLPREVILNARDFVECSALSPGQVGIVMRIKVRTTTSTNLFKEQIWPGVFDRELN